MVDIPWGRILILCLFQWGNADGSIIDDRSSDEEVRAIAASYIGNIDSFTRCRCEYVLNQYRPKSLQEIKNGDCLPEAMATAHYQRDGDKIRFEVEVGNDTMEEIARLHRSAFNPMRRLIQGNRGIAYSMVLNGGVLYSEAYPPEYMDYTPFSFGRFAGSRGCWNPGVILQTLDGFRINSRLMPNSEVDAETSMAISLANHQGGLQGVEYTLTAGADTIALQFWISPEDGFLPVFSRLLLNDQLSQIAILIESRHFSGGRCFPIRVINAQYAKSSGGNEIAWVLESSVKHLEVDKPVSEAAWFIDVDSGAALRNAADDRSQFKIESASQVHLDDLEQLFQRAAAQSRQEALWAEARLREKDTPLSKADSPWLSWSRVIIFGNVALFGLALVVILFKRRRRDINRSA